MGLLMKRTKRDAIVEASISIAGGLFIFFLGCLFFAVLVGGE